jgi:hypothetical protein
VLEQSAHGGGLTFPHDAPRDGVAVRPLPGCAIGAMALGVASRQEMTRSGVRRGSASRFFWVLDLWYWQEKPND